MSKLEPRSTAGDQDAAPPPSPEDSSLDTLFAEREALCTELSARQVEFATLVRDQACEISGLREALAEAQVSVADRYAELARLSRRVLDLEDASAETTTELIRQSAAMKAREDSQASEILALQAQLKDLQEVHATAMRVQERDRVLLEHAAAIRASEAADLRQAMDVQREIASRLRDVLVHSRATRAWKLSRFILRQPDIVIPPQEAPFDALEYQKQLLARSDLFDAEWYLTTYPDAAGSGLAPAEHYLREGAAAGHNPSPSFDTVAYLRRYPDVRTSGMNPLVHYLEHGNTEQREVGPDDGFATRGVPAPPCS